MPLLVHQCRRLWGRPALALAKPANEMADDMKRDALNRHLAHGECLPASSACRSCPGAGSLELLPPDEIAKAYPENECRWYWG